MSVRAAPMSLARPRRRLSCLGALGYVVLGAVACALAVGVLNWRHVDRVRQWHPYGAKGPVVTASHAYTWGHLLDLGVVSFGYDRYELTAGEDPSGSYGEHVPVPRDFSPRYDDLSKVRVTADASGITIAYPGKDRAFIPKANLKGR